MLSSRYALLIRVLLVTGLALNGFMVWKDRELVRKGYPDFTIFYSAGKMVRTGLTGSLYDERAEFQTQLQFAPDVSIRHGALPYNHPPFEALLFVPLSFLSYFPAYLAWDTANLLLLGLALARLRRHLPLLRTRPWWAWVLCAVAFFPIFICLLQGQDMILFLFLLVAAFGYFEDGADFWAGCCLGMGMFRPQLVLPLTVILLFGRRVKAVFGVACSALGLAAISIAMIGWHGFLNYPGYVWKLEQIMGRGAIVPDNMPNVRGFFAIFFRDGHPFALLLTAAGSVLLLILAIRCFRSAERTGDRDLGFSVAVLVSVLTSYHAFMYDLGLLFLPALLVLDKVRFISADQIRQRWESLVPVAALFFTPLLMFLLLWLSHLNFLTPLLFLWLWGMARELSPVKRSGLDAHPDAASKAAQA